MEVTGLAVGVLGLAGLFSTCLDSLSKFQSYRSSNNDTHVLDTRFRAARSRFEQWGVSVGISQGRLQQKHHPGLDNKETAAVIEDILQIIAKTICDEGIFHRNRTEARSQNVHLGGLSQSRGKRLKWALGGKEDRTEQVDIFEKLVQQLYNLVPPDSKDENREGLENAAWVEDIRKLLTRIEDGMKAEMRRNVYSWLGTSTPEDKYEDSLGKRVGTTCEWIFDRPAFKSLLSPEGSSGQRLLWINGPAGFGKTILCAHIIKRLSEILDTPVAYFFFTSDHESREDPFFALRAWISQVAAQNDNAFECIRQIWEKDTSEAASRKVLVGLFKEIVTAVPGCLFVADGLDECSQLGAGDSSVARFLHDIMEAINGTDVKLLLVSRDEPEIRGALEENEEFLSEYRIGTNDVEADTAAFSQSVVDTKLSNKSEDLRLAISEAMAERCQGQFLWIKMQEQSLRSRMSKKRLNEVVENMPSGLDCLYDHNWERIMSMPPWDRDRAFALLRWTAFAYAPLTVYEITEAILITQFGELNPDEYPENIDDDYIRTEIVGLCAPLLEIRDSLGKSSPGYRTLHIPHFSVRQYLIAHLPLAWMQTNDILHMCHQKVHHTVIARACLQYLSLPQVWEAETQENDIDIPSESLLLYAAVNWTWHAKLGFLDSSFLDLSKAFLSKNNTCFKSLVNYLAKVHARLWSEDTVIQPQLRPLEYVFYVGWIEMAGYLMDEVDINEIGAVGRSPIFSACEAGSAESVKMLIQCGADLNIKDATGTTCLHLATRDGLEEIVKILIDRGAEVSAQNHSGFTPLHLAAAKGHANCCKYLIEGGTDMNIRGRRNATVVHTACIDPGRAEALRIILQKGPATLATDSLLSFSSPLMIVSKHGDADMAELLLEYGAVASLFMQNSFGETPLHQAASSGHTALVKLFIEHGSQITLSIPDMTGRTPLHYACINPGLDEIISLLLRPGAEQSVLMADEDGDIPLHIASRAGHASYVKSILQYQWPRNQHLVEARNKRIETPLYLASSCGHIDVVRELLDYGARTTLSVANKSGVTPLFIASRYGHLEIVDQLLSADSVDQDHENWLGLTPMFAAVANGHLEVTRLLISNGALIRQWVSIGQDLLWWAQRSGNPDLAELLKAQGALTVLTTFKGQNSPPGTTIAYRPLPQNAETVAFEPGTGWCDVCTLSVKDDQGAVCAECEHSDMLEVEDLFQVGYWQVYFSLAMSVERAIPNPNGEMRITYYSA
ncbi:hypothetical protein FBEOM_1511 [Fusarium beomiforme]|uniref:Ankyrin n=1 Tax=Fusarium beomiforme TaxID=44412 RepID=A0A9P5ATR6_9HYPO|nr:hypothetical protein FBEOM_1511 [Fusarium beomiforme]